MIKNLAAKDNNAIRQFKENEDLNLYRSNFGQDRDRIIDSNAFRRLQYKTQVFVNFHGDHYRTRLTHSLEVAQISRWISSGLNLNKDLSEIISLAHDLGHAPFGHAGENALNKKISQYNKNHTRFCHNAQAIKIVSKIENRFLQFKGLNLCKETIEGIAKHNGSFKDKNIHPIILTFNKAFNINLLQQPSLEAQISSYADDIAYNNHDLEDGYNDKLFSLKILEEIDFYAYLIKQIKNEYININESLIIGEIKKRSTSAMVIDVIRASTKNISSMKISNIDEVKNFNNFLIRPSDSMKDNLKEISQFLFNKMYHHKKVKNMTSKAQVIIYKLFDFYINNKQLIPEQFLLHNNHLQSTVDYIAGMTDRYASNQYKRIINEQ